MTPALREFAMAVFGALCVVGAIVVIYWVLYLTAPENAMSLGGLP